MPAVTKDATKGLGRPSLPTHSGHWFRGGSRWENGGRHYRQGLRVLLFDLIKLHEPSFETSKAKVHLARHNHISHPINEWLAGDFDEWQRTQTRRNFKLDLVVSLIQVPKTYRWMFAGLFRSHGHEEWRNEEDKLHYVYNLERIPSTEALEGRLFLTGKYTGQQSYPGASSLVGDMDVYELLPEKLGIGDFPGFKKVDIDKSTLDLLMRTNNSAWRTALSSVKGIYLITDTKTGKLYVGKADGEEGIWGRWGHYANTGHGGNRALVQELGLKASDRQNDLKFSLLEIADIQTGDQEIDERESHWKNILMSRAYGYNRN
ncbi:GIY-YIG nuclease family protein [uncultured Xanthomonas sp.]|uniref:GIY-YIG nuclease family protein n=1 Tax=uncultured Xanthomonas sp. TaxID=152831 RepID=UPI00374A295D